MKRNINTHIAGHRWNCQLIQGGKAAAVENILTHEDNMIRFEEAKIFSALCCVTQLYREAIEMNKHTDNMNRKEKILTLNKTWNLALWESWNLGVVILVSTDQVEEKQVIGQAMDQPETRCCVANINVAGHKDTPPVAEKRTNIL